MCSVALFRQHFQLLAEVHFRGAPEIVDNFMGLNVSLFVLQKKLRQIFFGFKLALRASIHLLILFGKRLQ